MRDADFAAFLRDVSAVLGLRTAGYRRTGASVRKRLYRRLRELNLSSLDEYRAVLVAHPAEWEWLDACCRITISRWWRDAGVFERVARTILPERAAAALASGQPSLRIWSAGCASGEEAYSLALIARLELRLDVPDLALDVLGSDANPVVLARAQRGVYPEASLRELPERLRELAFERRGPWRSLRPEFRAGVRFERADLRRELPSGPFDLICCRNLAFTYFDDTLQRRLAAAFAELLRPGGALILGLGERLPPATLELVLREPCIYLRAAVPLDPPLVAAGSAPSP